MLLGSKDNVQIGNKLFAEKKKVFKDSPYLLTAEVAEYKSWGPNEITKHQIRLAQIAPKVWPL